MSLSRFLTVYRMWRRLGGSRREAFGAAWGNVRAARDVRRRRTSTVSCSAGGVSVYEPLLSPMSPGSPLYGGHAAPATCHSHGDGGFSCSSGGGSDGGGGGD
jgi:hypothetical protein